MSNHQGPEKIIIQWHSYKYFTYVGLKWEKKKKKSQTKQKGKQTKALISILQVSDQFFYIREKSRDGAPGNMPPGLGLHGAHPGLLQD